MSAPEDIEDTRRKQTIPEHRIILSTLEKNLEEIILLSMLVYASQFRYAVIAEHVSQVGNKQLPELIKRRCDENAELNTVASKGPWHCILGKSFAVAINHIRGHSLMIEVPILGETVCLFKIVTRSF